MTTTLRQPDAPHLPVPADLVVDPATVPEDRRHLIPRFDAPVWPITFISDNPSDRERQIYWSTFPAELQDQFRHAAWALLNIPVSDQQLFRRGAGMRARLSIMRIYLTICQWRIFATWLDRRGITELAEVSAQVLTEYSLYLSKTRKVSRSTAVDYLVAVTRLHICAPHLPASSRIGVPPWDEAGLDDYLPAATASGENATEPISPATMGPLLVWALRFVEEFAVDVLAAHAEEQRLRQVTTRDHGRSLPSGTSSALASYLDDLIATGRPLPARPHRGPGFAPSAGIAYIAAITDSPHGQVQRVLQRPRWRGYLAAHPGPCPLDTPITGTIDGVPWLDSIDYYDVGHLVRHLTTACFVVIAYLTGMRPGEVLALDVGCCPDPEPGDTGDPSSGIRRHLIRGRHFKTARDDDGNHLSAGVTREAPWIAVPPVVTAIRMLERLVGPTGLLFPRDRGSRPRSLTFDTMGDRMSAY